MALQRLNSSYMDPGNRERVMNFPEYHYYPLSLMGAPFLLEKIFALYRRTLLGAIKDPTAVLVAISITAIEEAIARSTMVLRDTWLNKILGRPEMTDAQVAMQRKIW